jgi:hypothetical protein
MLHLVFEPSSKDYRARLAHLDAAEVSFGHGGVNGHWWKEDCQGSKTIHTLADNALPAFIHHWLAYFEAAPNAFILHGVAFTTSESQLGQ